MSEGNGTHDEERAVTDTTTPIDEKITKKAQLLQRLKDERVWLIRQIDALNNQIAGIEFTIAICEEIL